MDKARYEYRNQMIQELKKKAGEVKLLKETHRKRRPIIIEFSGSPKAGKTSCINSLKQFLKRNGFEVEVIQERASICPVSDKQSPMFNIWTSCMSLAGLIGIVEDKKSTCDVIILDRGVFDALCWFEWLTAYNKMESDFQKKVCEFLLRKEFVGLIDIVFSFTVEPETSIEREYANLLTDQIGSIMNLEVLGEYKKAVDVTVQKNKKLFKNIIPIDTNKSTQDEVGKEVTQKTLETLSNLLDKKIGYITINKALEGTLNEIPVGSTNIMHIPLQHIKFDKRLLVEQEAKKLQPIPILVLTDMEEKRIFSVKKRNEALSKNSTEKNKLLLYVGGHIRAEDVVNGRKGDYLQTCREALQREVKEELGISIALKNVEPIYIYGKGEQEKKHIAICYKYPIQTDGLKITMDSHELIKNSGTTKSGKFLELSDIIDGKEEIEQWSALILNYYWGIEIEAERQMSLFD